MELTELEKGLIEFLNRIKENGIIWLVLVSLISADTLLTVKDCDNSIKVLTDIMNVISETDYDEKDEETILKYCKDGIEICERDKNDFLKNKKE